MGFTTSPSYHGYSFTSETPLLQRRTSIDGHIASEMLRIGKLWAISNLVNGIENNSPSIMFVYYFICFYFIYLQKTMQLRSK